jgi:hypothetical protein
MKISDLLCQYLYQNKELVLEGFGVFHLDPSVSPLDTKEPQQVYQGITFEDNNKIKTNPELIDFLVQNSGKMKPLAISDLEAFLTTGRELLNIGKPLILNGIGTLTGYRTLEFTPGPFTPMRLDGGKDTHFRERVATSEDELFSTDDSGHHHTRTTSPQGRALIITLAALVVLLLVGYGVYRFAFHKKDGSSATDSTSQIQPVDNSAPAAQKDTTTSPKVDTAHATVASPTVTPTAQATAPSTVASLGGPTTFEVLIQSFNDAGKAHRRYDSLKVWGHNVVLETHDSTHLDIVMPFNTPLSDTSRIKDSLTVFFGHRVRILH